MSVETGFYPIGTRTKGEAKKSTRGLTANKYAGKAAYWEPVKYFKNERLKARIDYFNGIFPDVDNEWIKNKKTEAKKFFDKMKNIANLRQRDVNEEVKDFLIETLNEICQILDTIHDEIKRRNGDHNTIRRIFIYKPE